MFSATDDLCLHLPAANWKHLGSQLKYRDDAGNSAQIQDGQLRVRIRGPGPLGYTLDETTQGTVNAIFTSGTTGDRWCMQWTAALPPTRDEPGRYLARNAAAPGSCPAEPSDCPAVHTLSLTTTVGTSSCGPAGLVSNPTPPCSGELDSDTACTTELRCLGLGCLYIGDGNATLLPSGKLPDGATTVFSLSGTTLSVNSGSGPSDCSQGAGPGQHCVNTNATPSCAANGDCGGTAGACALDANCYFGPPLPILSPPPFGALTTCVLNLVQTDASGTADISSGAVSASLPLSSRVYITGNTTSPCPKCVGNACTYGKNTGGSCSPTGTPQTSVDCPPSLIGFQAALTLDLTPLGTGTASIADASGIFCPGQNPGAFGQPSARCIMESGMPAGPLADQLPHPCVLGSVFCIPPTGNVAIDEFAFIPGPGAISVAVNARVQ